MKSIVSIAIAGVAVFALSGCGGGDGDGGGDMDYYITRGNGVGVSSIVWDCDGGTDGTTNGSGRFYTEPGDNCNLDLRSGLIIGHIYLEDNVGLLNGVRYSCVGNASSPDESGWTRSGGLIVNAKYFTSCTLYNLP